MSQILIVMLYVLWVAAAQPSLSRGAAVDVPRLGVFFAGFMALVAIPAVAARVMIPRLPAARIWPFVRQFHWLTEAVKLGITAWFAVGVFSTDAWRAAVGLMLGAAGDAPFTLPAMVFGPLPAVLAWLGLWWAQYPVERMAREQSMLPMLESDLPIHAPPTLLQFFSNNLRMQILTTAVPLLMIALLRDVGALGLLATGLANPNGAWASTILSFTAAAGVLLVAPEPLRHILRTERLPPSSLRWRLDEVCRAARTRYREVLLWKTGYAMGNAAVMGVLPRVRYVLLSDLLLESMTDRQIEAVFAHELGHVVHRHTVWFVLVIVTLAVAMTGVSAGLDWSLARMELPAWLNGAAGWAAGGAMVAAAVVAFGFVSRRFERQADVYAARAMQAIVSPETAGSPDPRRAAVGPEGAEMIASALARAAVINNVPLDARSFRHGSIARRIRYIRQLAREPAQTFAFDRSMGMLFAGILAALTLGGLFLWWLETAAR